jgi:myo-inositol-1(or 4)-monophosphatase
LVTDRTGAALPFNRPHPQTTGVIAATPAVHRGLLGGLSP